ncbi:MAG: DNA-3-methyladenine glycosylase 2 family protein [Nocardioides sp.]|nr:DNA-3-methyladenine glycosylase 2 family protein [Nocardioides sp.]
MTSRSRTWSPGRPVPLGAILGTSRRGPGDPTYRIGVGGDHWRGLRTPEGAVTLHLASRAVDGGVDATAWGDGAEWVLDRLPTMLGEEDDAAAFRPHHDFVIQALRHHPHWRVGASGLVMDALVPAIIEQKVTGQEAFAGFRRLVRRYGEPAPGPGADRDLWVAPAPETVRRVPSWEWLRMPVDPARSRTVVHACGRAAALERTVGDPRELADRKLRSVPGIGVWTSAEVRYRAHGDADALSVGDYHVAANVGWTLVGEPFDDDRMVEELEVYRPHRYRVQRLVELMGAYRPRRGPRMAPRRHLPGS